MAIEAELARMLEDVRAHGPLVHCITNYVTVESCANAVLAVTPDWFTTGLTIAAGILPVTGFAIAFTLITLLHVVMGELVPKSVAIAKSESAVLKIARPLHFFWILFSPIIKLFDILATFGLKILGIQPAKENELAHSEEEIKLIVEPR